MSQTKLEALTFDRLANTLGILPEKLDWLIGKAGDLYQPKQIEHNGKTRELLIPKPILKNFQRDLYTEFFQDYQYHPAAYCCPGRGVLDAAENHKRRPYLLHLDIENFFPSVSVKRVRLALKGLGDEGVSQDFVRQMARLLTVNNEIPQGAPTSVAVGNLVLEKMDRLLTEFCENPETGQGLTYTRYVDDIAISGGSRLERYVNVIRKIIEDQCGWKLNDEKEKVYGPDDNHHLLGLVAAEELSLGEDFLIDLRETILQYENGQAELGETELKSLKGKIQWVTKVEPERGKELKTLLEEVR